jgi:hypothetical protein
MEANKDSSIPQNNGGNPGKIKKGLFPRMSLTKVLELPTTIYQIGQGEPVRRLLVFDRLGKAPASGHSRALVTISGLYNLTKGGNQADYLELTDLGKLLITTPKGSKKYYQLAYELLFANEVFSGFVDYWKNKALPSDEIAEDWLIRTYKLNNADGQMAWDVVKANLLEWELTEQLSGKRVVNGREAALEAIKDESSIEDSYNENAQIPIPDEASSIVQFEKNNLPNRLAPKPFGTQILERDFSYGRARLILPEKMTSEEISKIKLLIEGLVIEVKE